VLDLLAVKSHSSLAIFAAEVRNTFTYGIGNRHRHPLPSFLAITHKKFFCFAVIDLFAAIGRHELVMSRLCVHLRLRSWRSASRTGMANLRQCVGA